MGEGEGADLENVLRFCVRRGRHDCGGFAAEIRLWWRWERVEGVGVGGLGGCGGGGEGEIRLCLGSQTGDAALNESFFQASQSRRSRKAFVGNQANKGNSGRDNRRDCSRCANLPSDQRGG